MKDKVLQYVQEKGWQAKDVRGGVNFSCPFDECDDNKNQGHHFYIYFDNEVYHCVKCGRSGHLLKLKRLLGDLDFLKQESGFGKILEASLADQRHQALLQDSETMKYLTSRGINTKIIKDYKIGFDIKTARAGESAKCVVFPFFKDGRLTNLKYKSIRKFEGTEGGKARYVTTQEAGCTAHLFGIDNVPADSKTIIVTEGEYDALSAAVYGLKNVVSIPNGAKGFGSWVSELDRFEKIYLMYDNDKDGEEGADELAMKLGRYRCWRVRLPLKDLNECLCAGLGAKELQKFIVDAYHYTDESTVEIDKVIEKVDDLYANVEKARGSSTGYKQLDEVLGGYRDAEVTVITGDTTAGKTTFVLNALYQCLRRGQGVLIVSSEVLVEKVIAKLMSIHMEKNFYNRAEFTQEVYDKARTWLLDKNIFFVDSYGEIPAYKLQDAIELVSRYHGVRIIMLDHLHFFLAEKESEYVEIKKFTKEIERTVKRTKTHCFLVVHPKQMDDPEELRQKGMAFLRGGSPIKQNADNVAVLWRDKDSEEKGCHRVELLFKKVRDDNGKEGAVILYFDPESQKYFEECPASQKVIQKKPRSRAKLANPEISE